MNDPDTLGAYCLDSTNNNFLSFDNSVSINSKVELVKKYGLGGLLAWDNASDIRGNNRTETSVLSPTDSLTSYITEGISQLNGPPNQTEENIKKSKQTYNIINETINNYKKESLLKYINIDYLLRDLRETYQDRIHNLSEWLHELHIDNVNPSELTYDNIDPILDSIKQTHITLTTVQFDKNIALLDDHTDYELTQEEKDEDKKEITDKYENDIREINTVTIPDLRGRFEKLIRTKDRHNKLKRAIGGKKRKRRTTKLRKTANIRKRTRRYKHIK